MKPLEITFHGPFVFRFESDCAWAYAPKCDEHYLNILTDSQDVRLPLDKEMNPIRTFNMTGPKDSQTAQPGGKRIMTYLSEQSGGKKIMTYPWDPKKKCWPKTQQEWHYVLRFPTPDSIFGLVPEYMWIYGYSPDGSSSKKPADDYYARALRFRYESSDDPQFDEFKNNQIEFCANHLGGTALAYSIEIRYGHYTSVPRKKAEYYLDAQSCFESMRENLPPCDEWKAVFGEEPNKSGAQVRNQTIAYNLYSSGGTTGPHDCGAPVIVLLDGVSLEPTEPKATIANAKRESTK